MSYTLAEIQKDYGPYVIPYFKVVDPFMLNKYGTPAGVVLYDSKEDKVICGICRKKFLKITTDHVKKHGFNTLLEFKEELGLLRSFPLQSKKISRIQSQAALINKNFITKMGSLSNNMNREQLIKARELSYKGKKKISYRNKFGTCEDQIKNDIEKVKDIVGRSPSAFDLRNHNYAVASLMRYRYGSENNGLKIMGYKTYKSGGQKGHRYNENELLDKLKVFVRTHRRIPKTNELLENGLPKFDTYVKYFGSYNKAKVMAGLDQLLVEIKNG